MRESLRQREKERLKPLAAALLAAFVVLGSRMVALATGAYLVKDINDTPVTASSNPRGFAELNGRAVFLASTPSTGEELWSSDGTEEGTWQVVDLEPGPASADIRDLIRVGDAAFFTRAPVTLGGEDAGSFQLWRTDGSAAGTVFVAEIPGSRENLDAVDLNGTLVFAQYEWDKGKATLWRSDGTAAGTIPYYHLDFPLNSCDASFYPLTAAGHYAVFIGADASSGCEPWRTDGTAKGTFALGDLIPGSMPSSPYGFTATSSRVFFWTGDALDATLWVTDGSKSGSAVLAAGFFGQATAIGEIAYVVGGTEAAHGLWRSDGTPAGTTLIRSIPESIYYPAAANGTVYFFGSVLWTSDGTADGTLTITQPSRLWVPYPTASATLLYFIYGNGAGDPVLWRSDGSVGGTLALASFAPQEMLGTLGDRLFFSAMDASGSELWKSDGSPESTVRVKDIAAGFTTDGSNPLLLTAFKGRVYFAVRPYGKPDSVWVSDGTAQGTTALRIPGVQVEQIIATGDHLYVLADLDAVWATDGASAPVRVVSDFTTGLRVFDGVVYALGNGMCRIDGTAVVACAPKVERPTEAAFAGGHVFIAKSGRLAVSDAALSGTQIIGAATGSPSGVGELTALGDAVYFIADDGQGGEALWQSDGTESGTRMVSSIIQAEDIRQVTVTTMVAAGGRLFFAVRGLESDGGDLWRSDGTAAGTSLIARLSSDFFSGNTLAVLGDQVLFPFADPQHGSELWTTDNTLFGSHIVRDLYAGPLSSHPRELTPLGDHLAFSACDENGCEPYITDGTAAGTVRLADIAPNAASSFPSSFAQIGSRLFMAADDMLHGQELWGINLCTGDCSGDGHVTIDELITAVSLALTGAAPAACSAVDANGDGIVTIDELIAAVTNALNGCAI